MPLILVSKKAIFSQIFENLSNSFNVALVEIFGINQNIIQIYDNKKFELFG